MSSNAFMLPVLSQLPVPGLNGPDSRGSAAFKSDRIVQSTDPNNSFSATLKRVSDRHDGHNPKTPPAAKPVASSRPNNAQSPNPSKIGKTAADAPDAVEESEAPLSSLSEKTAPSHHPQQTFGWVVCHLMNLSRADDGSSTLQPLPDPADANRLFLLGDWIKQLQVQEQQVQGDPVGTGPFEQLQVTIAPEATNWHFFEQLAFRFGDPQGEAGQPVETVSFFGFKQWMFLSAALTAAGTLNGQTESTGANNGDPLVNPLLRLAAMGTTGTAMGLNMETGGSGGPNGTAHPEIAGLTTDLLKMAAPPQPAEAGISEVAKTSVADAGGLLSFWASGDAGSETPPEAQARQLKANFQPLKIQAALQAAAEQPANTNSTVDGITAKTPEEVFGIKSAALKAEIAPGDVPGNKWVQIDGESKDSVFLFSQDQMPPHLARLINAAQSSEAAQRSLMPQTMDQIVQRAVLSFNNGQHEVQIDLKPDFLGHIRMQIVSEGQQVAIKIVAELPFVRDMLENNLHQLKAVLQAQGLDINELEVSVAHDSHGEGDTRQAAKAPAAGDSSDPDDGSSEKQVQTQSRGGGATAETAIDYFA